MSSSLHSLEAMARLGGNGPASRPEPSGRVSRGPSPSASRPCPRASLPPQPHERPLQCPKLWSPRRPVEAACGLPGGQASQPLDLVFGHDAADREALGEDGAAVRHL